MIASVRSKNHEILLSGSLITFSNDQITFTLDTLNIHLKFENDRTNTQQSLVKYNVIDGALTLTMTNCNNSLGVGNIKPLKIGTINSRGLFLNYMVYSLGKQTKNKLLNYCWYLEIRSRG